MTKLVLLILFSLLCFVKSILTDENIITSNGKILFYENSPATFICKSSHAIWEIEGSRNYYTGEPVFVRITECNCPLKCEGIVFDKTRITAYCNGSSPVLHFKQLKLVDNYKTLKCVHQNPSSFKLLVGRRNDHFYPEKPFALAGKSYTLVCKETGRMNPFNYGSVLLFDDERMITECRYSCNHEWDNENFNITRLHSLTTFVIRKMALKDDGKVFGCYFISKGTSLLKLTVNVPVSSVSLYLEGNGSLIEGETVTFVCRVDESKPKAFFEWLPGREMIENINVTSKLNGKLWQTNSTLKLKLKRYLQTIQCGARVLGMAWTYSKSLILDVKYPPPGKLVITVTNSEVCVGERIRIRCEWRGGNPSASLTLTCLSKTKTKKDSVTIIETVTQEMSNHCRCEGVHIAKNASSTHILNIQYYPIIKMPNRITVIENATMEFDCNSEGNPEPTNSWQIGNKIMNSRLLRTSFTRQNASGGIQCIASVNTLKYGILKTVQMISIVVTYAPEITISYENSEVECSANANPANITYELVQKWGNIQKRRINGKKIVFQKLTYQDAGEWSCQASNGVHTNKGKKYSEKSVKVKVNTSAQFNGNETEEAKSGHQKTIKVCFYCHPEAISMQWHSEHGKLSSDKSAYSAAEDGQFPFIGNCSTLTLDITEQSAKNYEFTVENSARKSTFSVNLVIKRSDVSDDNTLLIILAPMISEFVIIMIISCGMFCRKYRRYSMKKKPARKNHPLPSIPILEVEPTEDVYDDLKFDYENLDEQQKEEERTQPFYLEMLQTEEERTQPFYLEMLQTESREAVYESIETHQKEDILTVDTYGDI